MIQPKYTDEQIIQDFRSGGRAREQAWKFVFLNWFPKVVKFIAHKGGEKQDVLDALNEVAMRFQSSVCKPDFVLTHQLFAYFKHCVYHEWMRWKKREGKRIKEPLETNQLNNSPVESIEREMAQTELTEALQVSLEHIGERCKKLLVLFFFEGYTMKGIAEEMGFAGGEQVAKNEKMKCWSKYLAHLRERPDILQHLKNLRTNHD